jgi:tyrosinase
MNLGPVDTKWPGIKKNPSPDGLGYNPRCLTRDFLTDASMGATDKITADLIKNSKDIHTFQNLMQGDHPNKYIGVHSAGHYTIGGDTGADFYNSPSDPYFYFHHAQIDRVWWTWQNQDIKNRQNAIADTITFLNLPPSRNGTLNDTLTLGSMFEAQFPNITQGDAMSTLAGPFCYVYA